jgi:branched-chain amino acid transport system ATP-binding protein
MTHDIRLSVQRRPVLGLGSPARIAGVLALVGLSCMLALQVNGYWVFVLANVALFALVGIGLNVLMGLTGQVSLGHVGFYAIGAYAMAVLTTKLGLSFWVAWPLAAMLAASVGALLALPAMRVKGPYLAMITIAFGFVVEHSIVEMRNLTGGQNGIMGIAAPSLGSVAQGERAVAVIAVLSVGVALAAFVWLSRGAWGAAMRAVRDSETAAESIGLNPLMIKTMAFAVSALCAGAAGALFAPLSGMVTPHTFGFTQSILFVLVLMLGGSGTASGPLVGALIVGLLPELLSSLEEYRLLFFGGLLLLVLWVAPVGIVGFLQSLSQRWQPVDRSPQSGHAASEMGLSSRFRQAISAQGLSKQFGGVRAVSDLSFQAPAASVTSLIGPNGAGKSTALNMLSGFYPPTLGSFRLGKSTLSGQSAMKIARAGVARTYQTSLLFDTLSVEDNVLLAMCRGRLGSLFGAAQLRSPAMLERARTLLNYCGYRGRVDERAVNLPHVDRRLVEIARALALDPDALLLDEPAAGLSREDKTNLAALLRRIADAGITVLLVEHDMTLVMDISDHIVVLDAGQPLAAGTPAAIQSNLAVRQAYLGESLLDGGEGTVGDSRAESGDSPWEEMLGVGGLVAGYGAEPVLHSIDLRVRRGEFVALLGANGAGKSTLMRSLAGLHRPVRGGIHLDGRDLTNLEAEEVVACGMVLVPEGRQVFAELSVLDNIRLGAFLHPQDREARVEDMLMRFPRLRARLDQRAGLLSGGEQQMLAIARALMSRPRILLLDEPSLGLAPKVIAELFASLVEMRRDGMTLLLVDQMAGLALALADRAYVIEEGRIVAQGSAAEIAADNALAQIYLGEQTVEPAGAHADA